MPGRLSGARGSRWAWPLVVVVGLLVAGALAGVAWEAVWSAPSGVAVGGSFVLDGPGAQSAFDGTGLFVLVSAVVGLLAGVVIGWVTRRDELAVLAVAVLGAAAATALMYVVGTTLGPPDPGPAAAGAEDLTALEGDLSLAGRAPWLVLTASLLVGLVVSFLGFGRRLDDSGRTAGSHRLDWRGAEAEPPTRWSGESVGSSAPAGRAPPPGGR